MSKRNNLIHQYKKNLQQQIRFGASKHQDKLDAYQKAREANTPYVRPCGIYSTNTYKTYDEICQRYINWVLEHHRQEIKTYEDCKPYVAQWLMEKETEGLSAWSLNVYGSALASSYNIRKSQFGYAFPSRERKHIKRNRFDNLNGKYYSKQQQEAHKMLIATGCRRAEILRLRKDDFRKQKDASGRETGNLEVYKRGKGGIQRWCLVNPNYTEFVQNFLSQATTHLFGGEDRLFLKSDIPKGGIHSTRAIYAAELYDYYKKEGYASGKLYHCRKELAGTAYDKGILQKVSYDLQHARHGIVIQYLWLKQ